MVLGWPGALEPVCGAIASLLHPNAEVVLNDVDSDTIVGIWNPLSGRKVGDPALVAELPMPDGGGAVFGPYRKVHVDGRALTSVTAVICDEASVVRGLLCINLDRSPLDEIIEQLRAFAAPVTPLPAELFAVDWREQIAITVDVGVRERGLRRNQLTKDDRLALVRALDERGLFATRRAAEHAAWALGVSRATVYGLLKEVRS
jgi:predicted transcriptional regulator YheO